MFLLRLFSLAPWRESFEFIEINIKLQTSNIKPVSGPIKNNELHCRAVKKTFSFFMKIKSVAVS
jgi:hypothetical protein